MLPTDAPDADRIDVILQQLEERGASVNDLSCKVEYAVEDTLADDKFTKFGQILYRKQQPSATPITLSHRPNTATATDDTAVLT